MFYAKMIYMYSLSVVLCKYDKTCKCHTFDYHYALCKLIHKSLPIKTVYTQYMVSIPDTNDNNKLKINI